MPNDTSTKSEDAFAEPRATCNIRFTYEDSCMIGFYKCDACKESFAQGEYASFCPLCGCKITEIEG